jgi:hypothetical protein
MPADASGLDISTDASQNEPALAGTDWANAEGYWLSLLLVTSFTCSMNGFDPLVR